MGRYIIDNPEPPGAMEQLRGNVNRLGQTMLQLKMAEIERKRKLEEENISRQQKFQDEVSLLREKSKMEQESPVFRLGIKEKVASTAKAMDSTIPEAANYLGVNYQDLFGAQDPSISTNRISQPAQMDINPSLSDGATTQKPVFGNLIPDTYESKTNRITGQSTVEPKTFLNPGSKIIEKSITENVPAINKANTLDSVYNNIENLWLKTSPKEKGGFGMLAAGPYDYMAAGLQRNPKEIASKEYLDFIGGIRALLARGMGDVGNLSQYEQQAVIESVPKIGPFGQDIKQTGLNKMNNLRKVINDIKEARKQGMTLEAYQSNARAPVFGNQQPQQQTLPENITEEDIQFTMEKYGVSREEVLKRIAQ